MGQSVLVGLDHYENASVCDGGLLSFVFGTDCVALAMMVVASVVCQ